MAAVSPPRRGSQTPPLARCCLCQGATGAVPPVLEIMEVVPTGDMNRVALPVQPGCPKPGGSLLSPLPTCALPSCPVLPRWHLGPLRSRNTCKCPCLPQCPCPSWGHVAGGCPAHTRGCQAQLRPELAPVTHQASGVQSPGAAPGHAALRDRRKTKPSHVCPKSQSLGPPWGSLGRGLGHGDPAGDGVGSARPGAKELGNKEELELGSFPDPAGACPGGGGHTRTQPRFPGDLWTPRQGAAPSPTGTGDPPAIVGAERVTVRGQPPGGLQRQPGHP